jgi:DNA-binding MarR family transcriptional regulator
MALPLQDYRLLAEFRHVLRQFLLFSETAAKGAGLAPQQHQALLAIKGFGGEFTVGDLAEKLAIRPNSAVELVDRLAALKLLRRQADAEDRRRVMLLLTPKAENLLESLTAAHRRELKKFAPLLGPLLASLKD